MNYSELLQLAKGWSNFKFYRGIIWRLRQKEAAALKIKATASKARESVSALRQLFFFCRRSAGTINQIIYQPFFLTAFFFLPTVNVPGFFFLFARIIIEIKKVKTIVMKAGKM